MSRTTSALQRMSIPADLSHLARLGDWMRQTAEHECPEDADLAWRLELAVHEVATNIVRHAYAEAPDGHIEARLRREGDEGAADSLDELLGGMGVGDAGYLVRAFSTYFQVVNLAEKVHRIRRRRDYLSRGERAQP